VPRDVVDVSEARGADKWPHRRNRKIMRPMSVGGELTSRRAKAQRCSALLSVGLTEKPMVSRARSLRHQCRSSSIRARALYRI
jgi:hypothetical protein